MVFTSASIWVVPTTRVTFWYPYILGAVIKSATKGAHNFESNPFGTAAQLCSSLRGGSGLRGSEAPQGFAGKCEPQTLDPTDPGSNELKMETTILYRVI